MAVVYITEHYEPRHYNGVGGAVVTMPPIASQTVAIGGSSTQSSAFSTHCKCVRVHTDAICSIAFGANPTATSSSARLAANQTEYFDVSEGHKIAVITNT